MLDLLPFLKKEEIEVERKEIEVILTDDSLRPLTLSFPPIDELEAIRHSYLSKISVHDMAAEIDIYDPRLIKDQLEKNYLKYEKFKDSPTFLAQLADLHLLLRQYDKAEKILEDAYRRFGNDFLKHNLAEQLVRSNRFAEASALYDGGSSVDAYSLLRKAFFAIQNRDTEAAERFVQLAADVKPDDYHTLTLRGGLELFKGNCEKAIRNFRLAVQVNPNSSVGFVNLATAYYCTRHVSHALRSLRTAIELNPLNENAIIFYSDLTFSAGEPAKAINCLCAFTKYNQKSDSIWERLARAYYFAGEYHKAVEALKHQASIKETSSVWNNIGLAYWKLKDRERGLKFISLAIKKTENEPSKLEVPLMNFIALLLELNKHGKVLSITKELIDTHDLPSKIQEKLYLKYVIALEGLHKHEVATAEAERLLKEGVEDVEVKLGLLMHLVYYKTVIDKDEESAFQYIQSSLSIAEANPQISLELWTRVHNNCMFSFLCFNYIDKAKALIPTLQRSFYKDPYSTATLGLYNLKKNRLEKAVELYKEAIRISGRDQGLKRRIKQRMNLEMGKYFENSDKPKAIIFLENAKKIVDGYEYVRRDVLALQAKMRS